MSLTTTTVGTSVPTSKPSLKEAMQNSKISDLKPSQAMSSGRATALPTADTSKLREALAGIDRAIAEADIKPAADRKAAAEQALASISDDMTLPKSEKASQIELLKSQISYQTQEIQRHVGTPAYQYYLLSLYDKSI